MPIAVEVQAEPDPVAIARRLAAGGAPGVALLHSAEPAEGARWSFVAADPDRSSHRLDPGGDDEPHDPGPWGLVPRWIGVVPYEERRPALERPAWTPSETRPVPRLARAEWHRYRAVACIDHLEGRVHATGFTAADAARLAARLGAPERRRSALRLEVVDEEPPARHVERVVAAQELIRRGDLYQVNLARALRVLATPSPDLALDLHERMVRAAPTPFAACLRLGGGLSVVSTTPELLLELVPGRTGGDPAACARIFTAPIKGTRPRGADARADRELARELDRDPKERAELAMIVDVERNDLGRVAVPGSVRVARGPTVHTHRTVHHRAALLSAQVRADVSREEVLAAMLPSGSVTGAPKVRAMEVIASLEPRRRGLYTGALGHVSHAGGVTLAMAIRTVVLGPDGEGEYLTGGGIVADSDPARELEETRWKALQLLRSLDA